MHVEVAMHPYLVSLCQEYVELVDAMRGGQHPQEELREIDSQRQVTHNQLLEITRMTRADDMYAYAKAVILAAKTGGTQ
jgi:hypothetical protein